AKALGDEGKFTESLAILNRAVSKFPANVKLKELQDSVSNSRRKANVETAAKSIASSRAAGHLDYALRQTETALATYPAEPVLLDLKPAILKDVQERSRRTEIERTLLDARILIDTQNADAAITKLNAALTQFQGEPELTKLLEMARQASNQNDT